jgi:hypothetical protein
MKTYRLTRPPRALRDPRVPRENIALVPGSALPYKAQWQAIARSLPAGSALVIMPTADSPAKEALKLVAATLEAEGHRVTLVPAERFG